MTLVELLDASRVFALRTAIVDTLAPLFPGCEVKSHPGRLDADDVVGDTVAFATPSLMVGVIRVERAEGRMSGYRDVPVEVAVYVVTTDLAVPPRGLVQRDELALALCDGVLVVVENHDTARWGLADIAPPENAAAAPLFTSLARERGTVFYAVTWRQMLYTLGIPILDLDSTVEDAAVTVRLPGDPGWTPPTPPIAGVDP